MDIQAVHPGQPATRTLEHIGDHYEAMDSKPGGSIENIRARPSRGWYPPAYRGNRQRSAAPHIKFIPPSRSRYGPGTRMRFLLCFLVK